MVLPVGDVHPPVLLLIVRKVWTMDGMGDATLPLKNLFASERIWMGNHYMVNGKMPNRELVE